MPSSRPSWPESLPSIPSSRPNRRRSNSAKKARVKYVDVLGPSRGHDICAGEDAWINGANTDLMRALAFHPFAAEQQAVADLIMQKLDKS